MMDIASVKVDGKNLVLSSLFGEKKEITAAIREIDFTTSLIKLEMYGAGVPAD